MADDTQSLGALAAVGLGVRAAPTLREGFGKTMFFAAIGASGRIVVPVIIQQAIDRGIQHSNSAGIVSVDTSYILRLALFGALWLTLASLSQRHAVVRLGVRSEIALFMLRVNLFEHIHRLSLEDHDDEKNGSLVARVTSDVETLSQFFSWGALAFLLDGLLMLVVGSVMLSYDWILGLLVIAISAPLMLVLKRGQSRLVKAYDLTRSTNADLLSSTAELVTGAETLRAYDAGRIFGMRSKLGARRRADTQMRATMVGAILFPSGEIFGAFAVSAVVMVGVVRGPASGLTTGALIGFVFLTYRFLEPIAEITEVLFQTQTAVSGLKRVLGVLAIPVGPPQSDSPISLPVGSLDIDIRNVGFTYQTREVGDRGSFEVPALVGVNALITFGSRVAVVGETGSGKTTLGRLLGRFSDPTIGGITLGGVALTMVANDELRKRVVIVPQEPFLFDDTIGNNLRFVSPSVSDQQLRDVFGALGLEDWLTGLKHGLETVVGQRGAQLSSGERQLIALVRASLVDPAILVLDEATSSVDAVTELRLGRAMEKISQGRTTISIAHRLSTAKRADRILVLNQGRLVEDGSHFDLVDAGGTYASMYSSWITATDTSGDEKTFPEMR